MNLTAVEQLGKHYNEQGPSGDSLDDLQIIPSSWLMPLDPRKWELDGSGHSFLEDNKSTADHVNSKWKLGKHHTMHRNSTDKALSETESEPPNQDIANKTEQSSTSTVPMLLEGSYTFSEDEELPWKHIDNLGRGGFGSVDRVRHVQSGQIMARKVLRYHPRQAKRVKAEFEKEIAHLKKLNQHKHIVRLVCSYQQGCDFGILLLPVAPGNLYEFLQKRVSDEEQQRYFKDLYQSFGCLLSGLSFIHSNGIRHKDIKPQNILVDPQSPSKFLFTDFGLSRDFSDLSQSYTSGRPDAFSSRYCAPEVAAYTQRGRKADIFSLGCVFIEIVAVLCGNTPDYLENVVLANIGDEQADTMSFSAHHEGVVSWISQERARQRDERALLPPLSLCETMIRENPSDRPHLNILLPQIKRLQEAPYLYFCEHCHFELDLEIRSGGWPSNYQPPWIINDLKLQVHKIATGESKFSNTVQHIVQYTIEINAIHPPGVGYIAEVIFEAALYDCNTPPYQLCSRLILSRFAYLLNQLNITVTIPKDRGFQSLVGQLCQTEFGRATRISDCAEEDGLAMRKQRCLRFMQLLGRLYGYELVPTVDIVDCLSSLLKSMQAPTEFGVEKLVILLTTVGTFLVEHPEGQFIVESSIAKLWLLAKSAPLCLSTRSRDLLMEFVFVARNRTWQVSPSGWLVNVGSRFIQAGLYKCQYHPCYYTSESLSECKGHMEKAHLPESRALEALIDSYSISVINGVTYEQLTRRCQSIPTPSELFAEPTIATQTKNGVNFAFEKVREFGETARASSHLNEYESQARELDQLDQLGVKGGDQESAISKFAEVLTLEEATEEMRRRIEEQRTDLELEPGDTWL